MLKPGDRKWCSPVLYRLFGATNIVKTYRYQAFTEPSTIRILHLESAVRDDALRGTLEIIDVGHIINFEYWALPYVWDNPESRDMKDLGEGSLSLSENLGIALRRFRLPLARTTLWANAICIDQENPEERGQQVTLMAEIYNKAERVAAELGVDPLKRASFVFSVLNRNWDVYLVYLFFEAIHDLMKCEWFTTLWVVQEVILGKNNELVWGDWKILLKQVQARAHACNRTSPPGKTPWIGGVHCLPYKRT